MKTIKYILIFVAVFILAFGLAMPFFGRMAWGWGGHMPTMGYSHMPFGFFGGGLLGVGMFLVPLVLLGLLVAGIVILVRRLSTPATPMTPVGQPCAHCGKPLQAGWLACPHCGEKV